MLYFVYSLQVLLYLVLEASADRTEEKVALAYVMLLANILLDSVSIIKRQRECCSQVRQGVRFRFFPSSMTQRSHKGQARSVSGDRWKEDLKLQNLLLLSSLFFFFSCIWLPGFLQAVRLIFHAHVCDRWPALCGGISSQRASSIWTRCFSS